MKLPRLLLTFALVFGAPVAHAIPMVAPSLVTGEMRKSSSSVEKPGERDAAEGFRALGKNDLNLAETSFAKALRQDPRLVMAVLGQAEVLLRRNRPKDAQLRLEEAARLAPESATVQTALGRFHFSQKQHVKAEAAYKRAIGLDKGNLQAYLDLGDLYLGNLRKPVDAVTAYKGAISARKDEPAAHFGLGMALLASGDKRQAALSLAEAARLSPQDPNPFHVLGRLQASEKQFEPAIKSLSEALAIKPDHLPALLDRADIYAQVDRDKEAIVDYERIIRVQPGDGIVLLKLGMLYQRQKQVDAAKSSYLAALKANPNLPPAYNNLAMIALKENKNLQDALKNASKAVQLAPKVPQFHDTLGMVYKSLGDRSRAIAALEKAAQLPPPQAEILFHLGQLYEEAGQPDMALKTYRKALEIKGEHGDRGQAKARAAALSAKQ
jgi:tetratricopeptide (TPR) repeat protein